MQVRAPRMAFRYWAGGRPWVQVGAREGVDRADRLEGRVRRRPVRGWTVTNGDPADEKGKGGVLAVE